MQEPTLPPSSTVPVDRTFATDANAVLQSLFAGQIDVAEAQAQIVAAAESNITLES